VSDGELILVAGALATLGIAAVRLRIGYAFLGSFSS
jgi:hypothetical protein